MSIAGSKTNQHLVFLSLILIPAATNLIGSSASVLIFYFAPPPPPWPPRLVWREFLAGVR
jgi:hypothetical protein